MNQRENVTRNIVRVCLVAVIYLVALGVPDFGQLVSLVGGFANALMGFILPPLLFQTVRGWSNPNTVGIFFRMTITLLGVILLVSSTTFTVTDLVKSKPK
jgi:amino acid permease